MIDWRPVGSCLSEGELQVKVSKVLTNRRYRTKVWVLIVGSWSVGWVQVLKDWGASIEAVVVEDALDPLQAIRHLLTSTPIIIPWQTVILKPDGPWDDGCMFANVRDPQDSELFAKPLLDGILALLSYPLITHCQRLT